MELWNDPVLLLISLCALPRSSKQINKQSSSFSAPDKWGPRPSCTHWYKLNYQACRNPEPLWMEMHLVKKQFSLHCRLTRCLLSAWQALFTCWSQNEKRLHASRSPASHGLWRGRSKRCISVVSLKDRAVIKWRGAFACHFLADLLSSASEGFFKQLSRFTFPCRRWASSWAAAALTALWKLRREQGSSVSRLPSVPRKKRGCCGLLRCHGGAASL